jgi:Ca2+/Na+ antiporter
VSTSRDAPGGISERLAVLVGLVALVFSALYFLSDVIQLAQGRFSTGQLALTYVAEAAIPLFVIGLYAVQLPRIRRLGLAGAVGYAYAYIFFTGTVSIALVDHTRDWNALVDRMGPWIAIHGVVMVLAGVAFGLAVIRAGVLPRWTGVTLMVGVVLVAASSGLPEAAQTVSAGVRDLAFAGMGASLVFPRRGRLRPASSQDVPGQTPVLHRVSESPRDVRMSPGGAVTSVSEKVRSFPSRSSGSG